MICVRAARRRLLMVFTKPRERCMPIDPVDLEEIRAQLQQQ